MNQYLTIPLPIYTSLSLCHLTKHAQSNHKQLSFFSLTFAMLSQESFNNARQDQAT